MNSPTRKGAPPPDWVPTTEAARILSVSPRTLYRSEVVRETVKRKPAGKSHRRGWLWYRPDLVLIVAVRRRYELRTEPAARAIRNGLRG